MSTLLSTATDLPQLHIDTNYVSPTLARIVVVGDVDLATAPLLRDRLFSVLRDHTLALVDVDLSGVAFLDCTGIGALVAAYNAAVRSGCRLQVTNPQPIVWRVLEVTGLTGILTAIEWREWPVESTCRPGIGSATVAVR
jgi:anti-anti-sigma factor